MRPDLKAARFRAEALRKIRDFFRARGVLEVETPIASRGVSLDCHIDVFAARFHSGGFASGADAGEPFWLQTSPEPHMKRLLVAGFPDIWQASRAFRNGERGCVHNPEFTMLEWYRRDFSLSMLMEETEALCLLVAGPRPVLRKTYREAFSEALGADPLAIPAEEVARLPAVAEALPAGHVFASKADALDFAMSHVVELLFPKNALVTVHGFPIEQAMQSQPDPDDPRLARRFEVYGGGMELGNGYLELLDPGEYEIRFDEENRKRKAVGKPELPKDPRLLAALRQGLPPCAGVAVGLDRLLMAGLGAGDIGSVLNFPWDLA